MVCGPASALDVSWFLCAKRAVYIVFLVWLSSYICFRVLTTLVNAAACVLRSYHLYVCSQIVFVVWSWLQPPKAAGEKDPRVLSEIPDTAMQVGMKVLVPDPPAASASAQTHASTAQSSRAKKTSKPTKLSVSAASSRGALLFALRSKWVTFSSSSAASCRGRHRFLSMHAMLCMIGIR